MQFTARWRCTGSQTAAAPAQADTKTAQVRMLQATNGRHAGLNCCGGTSSNAKALTLDLEGTRSETTATGDAKQFAALTSKISDIVVIAGISFSLEQRFQLIANAAAGGTHCTRLAVALSIVGREERAFGFLYAICYLRFEDWLRRLQHLLLLLL